MSTTDPLVSVVVVTYQHAATIEACLNGILAQRTSFAVEILVGEDASTDGTREICKRMAAEHPSIRLFLRRREDVIRIGGRATGRFNALTTMSAARGRYLAMCEGDDQWTHPDKLQRQVEALEADPTLTLSFHQVERRRAETHELLGITPRGIPHRSDVRWLLTGSNLIPTCSVVYRRSALPTFPDWLWHEAPMADYPVHVFAGQAGDLHFIPEPLAIYHVGSGRWSTAACSARARAGVRIRELLVPHTSGADRALLREGLERKRLELAKALLVDGATTESRAVLRTVQPHRLPRDLPTQWLRVQAQIGQHWPAVARWWQHTWVRARARASRTLASTFTGSTG